MTEAAKPTISCCFSDTRNKSSVLLFYKDEPDVSQLPFVNSSGYKEAEAVSMFAEQILAIKS